MTKRKAAGSGAANAGKKQDGGAGGGKKQYRKATEVNGVVGTLCFRCRRSTDASVQPALERFFQPRAAAAASGSEVPAASATPAGPPGMMCDRCRRPLVTDGGGAGGAAASADDAPATAAASSSSSSSSRVLPQIARFRGRVDSATDGRARTKGRARVEVATRPGCDTAARVEPSRDPSLALLLLLETPRWL